MSDTYCDECFPGGKLDDPNTSTWRDVVAHRRLVDSDGRGYPACRPTEPTNTANTAAPSHLLIAVAHGLRPAARTDDLTTLDVERAREVIAVVGSVLEERPDVLLELGWRRLSAPVADDHGEPGTLRRAAWAAYVPPRYVIA